MVTIFRFSTTEIGVMHERTPARRRARCRRRREPAAAELAAVKPELVPPASTAAESRRHVDVLTFAVDVDAIIAPSSRSLSPHGWTAAAIGGLPTSRMSTAA